MVVELISGMTTPMDLYDFLTELVKFPVMTSVQPNQQPRPQIGRLLDFYPRRAATERPARWIVPPVGALRPRERPVRAPSRVCGRRAGGVRASVVRAGKLNDKGSNRIQAVSPLTRVQPNENNPDTK